MLPGTNRFRRGHYVLIAGYYHRPSGEHSDYPRIHRELAAVEIESIRTIRRNNHGLEELAIREVEQRHIKALRSYRALHSLNSRHKEN